MSYGWKTDSRLLAIVTLFQRTFRCGGRKTPPQVPGRTHRSQLLRNAWESRRATGNLDTRFDTDFQWPKAEERIQSFAAMPAGWKSHCTVILVRVFEFVFLMTNCFLL